MKEGEEENVKDLQELCMMSVTVRLDVDVCSFSAAVDLTEKKTQVEGFIELISYL